MKRVSIEFLKKLVQLKGDPLFEEFCEFLAESETDLKEQLVSARKEEFEVMQGRARELRDLNMIIESSHEVLRRSEEQKEFHPEHLT